MRGRLVLLILVAFTAAGAAVFTAQSWLAAQRAALASTPQATAPILSKVEILVAKADLPAGLIVTPDHLRWQPWPDDSVNKAYHRRGDLELDTFAGTVVRAGIAAGEPVTDTRIVRPGENGFLAAVLSPGMRAVTVPVNATTGISGFIFPGDRVDMILTHGVEQVEESDRMRRASETVLSDVRVLAIDQTTDDQGEEPTVGKTATIEVTPKQAEMVTLLTDLGRLSLSLRSLKTEEQETVIQVAGQSGADENAGNPVLDGVLRAAHREGRFTWDSEVSSLLPGRGATRTVQVIRGAEEEVIEIDGGVQ